MVDAADLKSASRIGSVGSNPAPGTRDSRCTTVGAQRPTWSMASRVRYKVTRALCPSVWTPTSFAVSSPLRPRLSRLEGQPDEIRPFSVPCAPGSFSVGQDALRVHLTLEAVQETCTGAVQVGTHVVFRVKGVAANAAAKRSTLGIHAGAPTIRLTKKRTGRDTRRDPGPRRPLDVLGFLFGLLWLSAFGRERCQTRSSPGGSTLR